MTIGIKGGLLITAGGTDLALDEAKVKCLLTYVPCSHAGVAWCAGSKEGLRG